MQNTLLQMNLLLATHSGKIVDHVKQWVLKCDACFAIHPISTTNPQHNMFCRWCGNAGLARLGVTLGADGTPRYHYKAFRRFNNRGTIYAIPSAAGGRMHERQDGGGARSGDLLLRGDQLMTGGWKERARHAAKESTRETLLDSRTVDDILGARGRKRDLGGGGWVGPSAGGVGSGSASNAAWLEVGWGKRNPNSVHTHHRKHKK
jgi:hypothetical protein